MSGRRGAGARVVMLGSGKPPESSFLPSTAPRRRRVGAEAISPFAALTEAQFQRIVRAELARLEFVVWVFPIMKRTMAGVPDLTFFHARLPGRLFCWELKRERRHVISPPQRAAIDHLMTVPGIDARIVRPSEWPMLRDGLLTALVEA